MPMPQLSINCLVNIFIFQIIYLCTHILMSPSVLLGCLPVMVRWLCYFVVHDVMVFAFDSRAQGCVC